MVLESGTAPNREDTGKVLPADSGSKENQGLVQAGPLPLACTLRASCDGLGDEDLVLQSLAGVTPMNVRSILMIGVISASTLGVIGCDDDGTGLEAPDLRGTWVASVYEYTDNADAQNVTDIIQRDGASFALTVDASGGASTLLDDGLGSTSSDSGVLNSTATTLTLAGGTFDAQRSGDALTLMDPDASFDPRPRRCGS